MRLYIILPIIILLLFSCTLVTKNNNELIEIDLTKDYPLKEVNLRDFCDVSYVKFDSSKDEYLFNGFVRSISKNTIIIVGAQSGDGDVHFFNKDGQFKSHFNRKGDSQEEYISLYQGIYDEETDEFFPLELRKPTIKVYNSIGEYKRTLHLPEGCQPMQILDFDEKSLLIYDYQKRPQIKVNFTAPTEITFKEKSNAFTDFIRVSKIDGKLIEYIPVPNDHKFLLVAEDKKTGQKIPGMKSFMTNYKNGFILFNQETDTMFYYEKDKSLIPLLVQKPSVKMMNPISYIHPFIEAGNYQFFEKTTLTLDNGPIPRTYCMRDKTNGKIYKQQIIFEDFKEKEITLSHITSISSQDSQVGYIMLSIDELLDAYEENRLSGELKELVADMNEEDNGILVLLHFK